MSETAPQKQKMHKGIKITLIIWIILFAATVIPWLVLAVIPCAECSYGFYTLFWTFFIGIVDVIAFIVGIIVIAVSATRKPQ